MNKAKRTTKQERNKYVQEFLASGKTQRSWCAENDINHSTFKDWLAEYKLNQKETKFIPLTPKNEINSTCLHKSQEILIEIGPCKIHVPEQVGIQLIMQAIKGGGEI